MSKKKKAKFYVVWKGAIPGVYTTWKECQAQIAGFPGAQYKSYPNRETAAYAFRLGYQAARDMGESVQRGTSKAAKLKVGYPQEEVFTVDAACSRNPGPMEYRCVHLPSEKEIFRKGPFPNGTNNIGEFLAIVHALALMKKKNVRLPIYTDSRTAMAWVRRMHAKTTLVKTPDNAVLFEMIVRAENWLKTESFRVPIYKWDTASWGEIPADFGRK